MMLAITDDAITAALAITTIRSLPAFDLWSIRTGMEVLCSGEVVLDENESICAVRSSSLDTLFVVVAENKIFC